MYKIYVNDTPLFLGEMQEIMPVPAVEGEDLHCIYRGKVQYLTNYIDLLEKPRRYRSVQIRSENYTQLVDDFFGIFKRIDAAGGLVFNAEGKVLLIYRLETWDLPKGKIDPGETPPQAAVREVQEETGLQDVVLGEFLTHTWHTYRDHKDRRVLKCTHWYRMHSNDQQLIPQRSENIEQAVWADLPGFLAAPPRVYPSILDVMLKV